MSDWTVPIVSGVIGSLIGGGIGGGIVAFIMHRVNMRADFDSRLSKVESKLPFIADFDSRLRDVESKLSFIEGKLSNFGQTPIAELTQKRAIEDIENMSKPQPPQ